MAKAKKKKKSQAPIALVYFTTLLVFMAVFGFVAYQLMKKMDFTKEKTDESSVVRTDNSFSFLFARINQLGNLADASVIKFIPEENRVIVVPLPAQTASGKSSTPFKEIYSVGGIKNLKESVEKTLNISIDYYSAVSDTTFENVYDLIGGVIFTPSEELYRLSENDDADDISYRAGVPVELAGRQARTLLAANVFSNGKEGNLELLGNILRQLINNAFQQVNATKNSIDIIYDKLTSNDKETNYMAGQYRTHKQFILEMLDKNLKPVMLKIPDGTWNEDGTFTIASTFSNELLEVYGIKKMPGTAVITADSTQESN